MGANGKVGQAAVQLAAQAGARVIAVQRSGGAPCGQRAPVDVVDARDGDVAARIRELTGGRGADIVFNTVGSPYFEAANQAMAKGAHAGAHLDRRAAGAVRHLRLLPRHAHLRRHRHAGARRAAQSANAWPRWRPVSTPARCGRSRSTPARATPLADALAAYRRVLGGDDAPRGAADGGTHERHPPRTTRRPTTRPTISACAACACRAARPGPAEQLWLGLSDRRARAATRRWTRRRWKSITSSSPASSRCVGETADGTRSEAVLGPLDSCRFAPGEKRQLVNRSGQPRSVLLAMPFAPPSAAQPHESRQHTNERRRP